MKRLIGSCAEPELLVDSSMLVRTGSRVNDVASVWYHVHPRIAT